MTSTTDDRDVSTHSRLKAAGRLACFAGQGDFVSTHSRLKAAGGEYLVSEFTASGFNTQPPEGGWMPRRSKP